jgi:hypothetical protein
MEWLFPLYWSTIPIPIPIRIASTSPSCGGHHMPYPQPTHAMDRAEPTACDLELVRVVYKFLADHSACARCGAALNPAIEVSLTRRWFTRARIVVVMHCQGPSTHRQTTKVVVERGDGLRFGPLRSG